MIRNRNKMRAGVYIPRWNSLILSWLREKRSCVIPVLPKEKKRNDIHSRAGSPIRHKFAHELSKFAPTIAKVKNGRANWLAKFREFHLPRPSRSRSIRVDGFPSRRTKKLFRTALDALPRTNELFREADQVFRAKNCERREFRSERSSLPLPRMNLRKSSSEREQIRPVTTQVVDGVSKARRKFRKTSRLESRQ